MKRRFVTSLKSSVKKLQHLMRIRKEYIKKVRKKNLARLVRFLSEYLMRDWIPS